MKFLTPNEGRTDRVVRVIIGIVLYVAGYIWLSGTLQAITYVLGAVCLVTGITGFCGLYKLLGINTCPKK